MQVRAIDHIVVTVSDIPAACRFYTQVLGMEEITSPAGRKALRFGDQKINLHLKGHEFEPKADRPTVGAADICLLVATPFDEVIAELESHGVRVELGPVERTGAVGALTSVYVRDPDGNLIELSECVGPRLVTSAGG